MDVSLTWNRSPSFEDCTWHRATRRDTVWHNFPRTKTTFAYVRMYQPRSCLLFSRRIGSFGELSGNPFPGQGIRSFDDPVFYTSSEFLRRHTPYGILLGNQMDRAQSMDRSACVLDLRFRRRTDSCYVRKQCVYEREASSQSVFLRLCEMLDRAEWNTPLVDFPAFYTARWTADAHPTDAVGCNSRVPRTIVSLSSGKFLIWWDVHEGDSPRSIGERGCASDGRREALLLVSDACLDLRLTCQRQISSRWSNVRERLAV